MLVAIHSGCRLTVSMTRSNAMLHLTPRLVGQLVRVSLLILFVIPFGGGPSSSKAFLFVNPADRSGANSNWYQSAVPGLTPSSASSASSNQQHNVTASLLRDIPSLEHLVAFYLNGVGTGLSGSIAKLLDANNSIKKLINELQEGISSRASCVACLTVTDFFRSPIYSKAAMSTTIRTICTSLRLQKPKICHGIARAFEDDLDYIGRHTKLSPEELCSTLLGVNCVSSGHLTEKLNWTVYIPPRASADISPLLHSMDMALPATLSIVQLTDIHADIHYEQGTSAVCDEPVCCRSSTTTSNLLATPWTSLDVGQVLGHVADEEKAGYWGDYRKCDAPLRTVVNALEQITKSHPEASYWLWTGDIGPHDHFSSREEVITHVRLVTYLVRSYVKVPVLPVIGNHEGVPANSFPPPSVTGTQSISWLYQLLAEEWSHWLPALALETLRFGGYYTVKLQPRLRTIVLNTNYCARLNPWTLYDNVDPGSQLAWLVSTLLAAELAQEKVHLLGHIAPDSTECTRPWLRTFLNILDRFQDTITGQFYGHSHRDEFRVYFSSKTGKAISSGFLGPSLTSFKGNNPAYRTYQINEVGAVKDYETYYFNLTEANDGLLPVWRREYGFKDSYRLSSVSHRDLAYLIQLMKIDDQLFQMFYRFYSRQAEFEGSKNFCDETCKVDLLEELAVDDKQKPKKITKKYN